MFTPFDHEMMTRALALAERGLFTTDPNPRVGCVLVRDDRVVGEGWHRKAGEGHAEVVALAAAGMQAEGATAYVTLEPCSHHGRTPPCADALLRAGVRKVVSALGDPNPLVNGEGVARLRAAGIEVQMGLLEFEARALNQGFVKRMNSGLPWVTLKLAASLDGRTALANGESRWITGDAARADVQRLRARSSAIVTGVGTVLADDPQLNVRDPAIEMLGRQPLRVICDSHLRTPPNARMLRVPGRTLIVAGTADGSKRAALETAGAEIIGAVDASGRADLESLLRELAARQCNEVLVESGPTLAGRFMELGLVDELIVYQAPVLLGQDARAMLKLPLLESMAQRRELRLIESVMVGEDLRLRLRPHQSGE